MKNNIILKVCWLLPLTLGILIFISWLLTKIEYFMIAGLINIYIGIFLTIAGVVTGIISIKKAKKENRKSETSKIIILIILLLSNFPIGIGILYSALQIESGFITKIKNRTNKTLLDCVLTGGGVEEKIGEIKPYEETTKTVWIKHDGTLILKYKIDNTEKTITIEGYVTNGMGGNEKINIEN